MKFRKTCFRANISQGICFLDSHYKDFEHCITTQKTLRKLLSFSIWHQYSYKKMKLELEVGRFLWLAPSLSGITIQGLNMLNLEFLV